jgi:hypothetical protein
MKILHISHHIGCMRDHAYIYEKLGFDYEFWKFPKGLFTITKEIANNIWNERKEYFNRFDFIVTSDTAPLSRIFMENLIDCKPKIIVWICNRFDYNMEIDPSFYEIFNFISINNKDKVNIIPYSDFEGIWCHVRQISPILPTITPIGINFKGLDYKIDGLQELQQGYLEDDNSHQAYRDDSELLGKMFIPIYGNDNRFFHLKNLFETAGIEYFNGGYKHPNDLKLCKGLVTFPDAFSKLITFETIQNEVVVFLPSVDFLLRLIYTTNNNNNNNNTLYWFNCPLQVNKQIVEICDWYRYPECRVYFDSIEDMTYKIQNISEETLKEKKKWCRYYAEKIERENIEKWKKIFDVTAIVK